MSQGEHISRNQVAPVRRERPLMAELTVGKKLKLDYAVIDGETSQLLGGMKPQIPCADRKTWCGVQ